MLEGSSPSRPARRKAVRVTATAFTGIAADVATALPATPARAATAYEARIFAYGGIPISKGVQVCGHAFPGRSPRTMPPHP